MLLMVPIYAITSWFSFVYVRESIYYDTIRTLYEAFVIASFFILILQYLGDSLEDQRRMLKQHRKTERWFFPLCCLKYNPSRPHFLQYMKWGILQYVPLNIFTTILTIVLQIQGSYCIDSWNPKFGHIWVLMISFCSVSAATYFLIMFYLTIHKDLKDYNPFLKFLAVKLVVFFSFWQSVAIEGLVYFGFIKATTYWSTDDISTGINAVLIDIEMVFFSLLHLKAFSYKPYVPLIPNPDFQPQQQELLSNVDTRNNDDENFYSTYNPNNRNNHYPSMDSIRSNRTLGSRPQMSSSQQPNAKKKSTSNADLKSGAEEKGTKKADGPPEKIMDFTQKTPIWKGILDAFNPLDTLRELGYGIQYLYRWIRGIPVDKDSRRLMDLERVFGRQRPEVPYIPTEDEDEKKKKKKKKKKGQESDTDNDSDAGDDGDDDDDEKDGLNKYGNLDDLEMGYTPGDNDTSGRYHRSPNADPTIDSGTRGAPSQGRADAVYDMAIDNPRGTMRPGGGVGSGAESNQSRVTRKPVKLVTNNNVANGTSSTAPGRRMGFGRGKQQQNPRKKDSAEYLGKDEAAHTERATLPDIQIEPVECKMALSGLYVDQPLPPVDIPDSPRSSPDIPVPMDYQRQPYHTEYERSREGERGLDRGQLQGATIQQPSRFEHRDPELMRAAAPYVLPNPVVPMATRPEAASGPAAPPATAAVASSSTVKNVIPQGTGNGFAQYGNRNIESSGPYQSDRRFKRDNFRGGTSGALLEARDLRDNSAARYHRDFDYDHDYSRHPVHAKDESGDTSFLSTIDSTDIGIGQRQFYHQREASRSDPELAHRRLDQSELYRDQDYTNNQDHDQGYDGGGSSLESSQAHQNPLQQQEQLEPGSSQPQPQQTEDIPEPKDDIDPIVAQYNQLQYRQKLQEQKRQQQEIEDQ
ncbi:hypothetical protein BGZ79_006550, partial [Entomortierella chlamydospora]